MAIAPCTTWAPVDGDQNGDGLADVLETTLLALQAAAGCPVSFCRTTPTTEAGVYIVVVEYSEEAVGRLALKHAIALCQAARDDASCISLAPMSGPSCARAGAASITSHPRTRPVVASRIMPATLTQFFMRA